MNTRDNTTELPLLVTEFVCRCLATIDIQRVELLQELWGGQGCIVRVHTSSVQHPTSILKYVRLDRNADHPRGWNTSASYERKAHSYEVERHWYEHYAKQCPNTCKVPTTLGVQSDDIECLILLEDLSLEFPVLPQELDVSEVWVCLDWLAHFHAHFLGDAGHGLWAQGCYWHLATRQDEYETMIDGPLKQAAYALDGKLRNARFQTVLHGDAKLANFCFNQDMTYAAGVDFQYVGKGCGMKDVTYFLGSCLSDTQCRHHEEALLNQYFSTLTQALSSRLDQQTIEALETEWRGLYATAWTDFHRFLLGWMPTHSKINSYTLSLCERSLSEL